MTEAAGSAGPLDPAQARQTLAASALAITEAIPVGTYTMVLPPEGGMASFGFMSERFLQICGLKREEAAADPFKAFACIHPDDYDDWVRLNAETFATKQSFTGECRVIVDGEVRWVRAESVPRDLPDGSTVWEGVLIDITAQRRALQQLEEERTLLNTVLGHIDGVVYMKDRQGRYLYANPSAEKLFPAEITSLVGLSDSDLMPAEAAKALRETDEQVFRDGGPLWREERLPQADGGERIFLSQKLLLRQPGNDPCLIGFSTEITQLRQATDRLAASEEQFRLLAENASDVVMRVDNSDHIVWVSPSLTASLGWCPQDWIGKTQAEVLRPGRAPEDQATVAPHPSNGSGVITREQIAAKDGSLHWVETHRGPYRNAAGEVEGTVASFRLIDAVVQAEQELLRSERQHRLLADHALDVVTICDLYGRPLYVSPSIESVRGWSVAEAMALPIDGHLKPQGQAFISEALQQTQEALRQGLPLPTFRVELEQSHRNGHWIWTEVSGSCMVDDAGAYIGTLLVYRDISARKQLEAELIQRASTDELTGLLNRRELLEQLDAMLEHSQRRRSGEQIALLFCDLDLFKEINDSLGHAAGDRVLCSVAERIRSSIRAEDLVGRMGGDEMVVVLRSVADRAAAVALGEEIAAAIRQPILGGDHPIVITASIGVTLARPGEGVDALMSRADVAMYAAKQAGRARVVPLD